MKLTSLQTTSSDAAVVYAHGHVGGSHGKADAQSESADGWQYLLDAKNLAAPLPLPILDGSGVSATMVRRNQTKLISAWVVTTEHARALKPTGHSKCTVPWF
jgi:hypothetical protein